VGADRQSDHARSAQNNFLRSPQIGASFNSTLLILAPNDAAPRRFPPLWSVEDWRRLRRDERRRAEARLVCFEEEPGRRAKTFR
jgi:hypothetical protein